MSELRHLADARLLAAIRLLRRNSYSLYLLNTERCVLENFIAAVNGVSPRARYETAYALVQSRVDLSLHAGEANAPGPSRYPHPSSNRPPLSSLAPPATISRKWCGELRLRSERNRLVEPKAWH